jgi:hypothetical protein
MIRNAKKIRDGIMFKRSDNVQEKEWNKLNTEELVLLYGLALRDY